MMIRKALVAFASAGLLLGSSAAVAQSADIRTASPVEEAEEAGVKGLGWVLALIVAAGVVLVITDDEGEDETPAPTSP